MRLAYFSPLPPQRSGIANYSADLLPHLAQLAEVTLFVDDPDKVDPLDDLDIRAIDTFCGPLGSGGLDQRFDMCIYQMGNNVRYHQGIYGALLAYPGITVLHDPNLYAFHDDLLLRADRPGALLRELGYGNNLAGVHDGRRILSHVLPRDDQRFPLLERIGDTSLGVITHSIFARQLVGQRCPRTPIQQINQPRDVLYSSWNVCRNEAGIAKARLGYSADELLLGSFGYAAPNKRIHVVLESLAELRETHPHIRYVVVGVVIDGYDLPSLVTQLGLDDIVRFVGYADDDTFADYLAAVDIGVNLRHPTTGETSAALMALMAAGTPSLVSDTDAFSELPSDACVKITTDANELSDLIAWMSRLVDDTELRHRLGRQAFTYIETECAPSVIARHYLEFAQSISRDLRHRKTGVS